MIQLSHRGHCRNEPRPAGPWSALGQHLQGHLAQSHAPRIWSPSRHGSTLDQLVVAHLTKDRLSCSAAATVSAVRRLRGIGKPRCRDRPQSHPYSPAHSNGGPPGRVGGPARSADRRPSTPRADRNSNSSPNAGRSPGIRLADALRKIVNSSRVGRPTPLIVPPLGIVRTESENRGRNGFSPPPPASVSAKTHAAGPSHKPTQRSTKSAAGNTSPHGWRRVESPVPTDRVISNTPAGSPPTIDADGRIALLKLIVNAAPSDTILNAETAKITPVRRHSVQRGLIGHRCWTTQQTEQVPHMTDVGYRRPVKTRAQGRKRHTVHYGQRPDLDCDRRAPPTGGGGSNVCELGIPTRPLPTARDQPVHPKGPPGADARYSKCSPGPRNNSGPSGHHD